MALLRPVHRCEPHNSEVVGCEIFATPNPLKSHVARNLKSPFSNIHAVPFKLPPFEANGHSKIASRWNRFGTPFSVASFAQDAPQPAADESIFPAECRAVAVFEVFKPAPQRPVHVHDDLGHAVPGGPLGLRPDRVPEFLATFA